jgi:uncharacterized membrane protein
MQSSRVEAFSDGVLAIIITIMILEIKAPHSGDFQSLTKIYPALVSYILSFIYVGIYWNNHHHLLQATEKINGAIMWANLHLLFWLSLIPFVTGYMGENHFSKIPVASYGVVLFMAAIAYSILQQLILSHNGKNSELAKALKKNIKGKISPILYLIGIAISFYNEWIAGMIYIGVALMWLVPDRRIEQDVINEEENHHKD